MFWRKKKIAEDLKAVTEVAGDQIAPGAGTLLLFWLFLLVQGAPAMDAIGLIFQGAFGSSFAWQSTLLRAAPLMLTALCVALPAQVGLIVIGGEGALALGGMCAAVVPQTDDCNDGIFRQQIRVDQVVGSAAIVSQF